MDCGIQPQALGKILTVLSNYPEVDRAILYGSRATGTYRPGSDIDITLQGPLLTLQALNQIDTDLDELLLPWEIDLSLYSQIDNPALKEHIERVGIPLYSQTETQTNRIHREV